MTRHTPIAPGRILGARVCLLAMTLLWTPMWVAAWQADGMACCKGGMCSAQGHHGKQKSSPQQAPDSQQAPMDCAHDHGSGMTSCTVSCCHEAERALTSAAIFVLPEPPAIAHASQSSDGPRSFVTPESVPSFEPLSPPPRTAPLFA